MSSLEASAQTAKANDDIDLSEIARTLARKWRRITVIAALVTGIAVYLVLFSRPQFLVEGSVYLGASQSSSVASQAAQALDFVSDFQVVSDVETQIELIQAKALLEQVIEETGFNASIRPENSQPMLFWRWRWHDAGSVDAFAPQPGDLEVQDATIYDPGSRGVTFKLIVDGEDHYRLISGGGLFGVPHLVLSGTLNQPASGAGVAFLVKPAVNGYEPEAGSTYELSIAPAKAVADALLAGPLAVSAGGTSATPTQLADIQLSCENPYKGQRFVNQLMQDFIATQLSWKTESASATEKFVAGQLQKIQDDLAAADQALAAYQSKTGIVDVPTNAQSIISTLSQYQVQRTTLLLQQEALQELAQSTAHPVGGLNPYLVSQTNDPLLSQLASSLANAEVQLQAQRVLLTPNAPEIQVQVATVEKIEGAIRTVILNDEALSTRGLANLDSLIAQYEARLKSMPAEALQVIALTRSDDVFGQLYILLMQREEEAEVSKAATIIDTRVVTPAEVPLDPTKPKAMLTIFEGAFLGVFLGMGLVLAQRGMSGRFHSDDEIRRAVGLPVYGLIPKRPRSEADNSIFSTQPKSPFIEAFRLLRSNLYQSASADKQKVILVTSPSNADGKTTIASNLSKVLSDDGRRVILVDADLHRGRLHEALKIDQAPGLTESLIGAGRPRLQPVPGQKFVALAAGVFPPNPSELLNEGTLAAIFDSLRAEFDFVIVDCPPLPAVADTMSLGRQADLILSVLFVDRTPRRAVVIHNETVGALDHRHGMIINGVIGNSYGYGYGYGYSYGYGYGYGYGNKQDGPVTWSKRLRRFISQALRG